MSWWHLVDRILAAAQDYHVIPHVLIYVHAYFIYTNVNNNSLWICYIDFYNNVIDINGPDVRIKLN